MDERRSNRIAGWSGIVFSILSLAVLPVVISPAPPAVGVPGAEVAAWFDAHRTGFLIGNYLGILAFVPGFVQLAVLVASIRKAEPEGGWLAYLVFGSGTFAYAVFACSLCVFQALPFLVAPHLHLSIEAIGSLAAAVWAGPERQVVGIELNVSYLRAATSGTVTAVCTPVRRGRTLSTYLIEIRDDQDRPTASARLTTMTLPQREQGGFGG